MGLIIIIILVFFFIVLPKINSTSLWINALTACVTIFLILWFSLDLTYFLLFSNLIFKRQCYPFYHPFTQILKYIFIIFRVSELYYVFLIYLVFIVVQLLIFFNNFLLLSNTFNFILEILHLFKEFRFGNWIDLKVFHLKNSVLDTVWICVFNFQFI